MRRGSATPTRRQNKDQEAKLIGLREMIAGDVRPALIVLLCSVGFVLLIACANIANLMLSRGTARRREIAVRTTLGATRARMVRQFLTESVVFSLVGGAIGLVLAYRGASALVAMFPATISNLSIPRIESIPIDGWVIGFAVMASIATGVLFGLAPAMQSSRMNLGETLKESGRTESGGAQGRRFRNVLTVAEVALSLMLLAAAGLMIQSFLKLVRTDPGFRSDHVLTMNGRKLFSGPATNIRSPSSNWHSRARRSNGFARCPAWNRRDRSRFCL